jgi:hypothetical protein
MSTRSILSTLLLIAGGTLFALLMATAILMLFPNLIFGTTGYYDRPFANQSIEVEFKPTDGDLFVALPGSIRPPTEDGVMQDFRIEWDAQGFRRPAQTADLYPIVVFGDSFTEGFNVPVPYADRLAELLATPVRNYGYRAYGPREIARAVGEFAGSELHTWLLYGYFAGNDLGDAVRPPKLDTSSPIALWSALFARIYPPPPPAPSQKYDFPTPVIIGGNYYEMAFLWYYWWWQLAPEEGFEASENFAVFNNALDEIERSVPSETCKALVFIPTKEQLYYRYIYQTERRWILQAGHKLILDADKKIQIVPAPIKDEDEGAFITALYGQYNTVKALIESKPDWYFIDLLPAFEQAVAEGQLLYYPYDSHWNQAGHDLAASVIAANLQEFTECPLNPQSP